MKVYSSDESNCKLSVQAFWYDMQTFYAERGVISGDHDEFFHAYCAMGTPNSVQMWILEMREA